ncbi:MAG: sigma 54-interacting transcriptional regulator [Firmicutes bacterium]|nr:sigma 54-interacting transcriptional regulator [Bacillota bacterium]
MIANINFINLQETSCGAVIIFKDISELETLKKELKKVKELSEQLDSIMESSFDGIAISDGNGRFIRLSKSYLRIGGLNPDQILGKTAEELVNTGVLDRSPTLIALREKRPVSMIQHNCAGKQIFSTSNPVFDEHGNIVQIVTNMRDMTELLYLREEIKRVNELNEQYQRELEEWRAKSLASSQIITQNVQMRKLITLASRVAKVDSTVLITGESGVGKEVMAKYIHSTSSRREAPLITVNCGAIPENLLESELFGYEKGAFTGANKEGRPGMFELAHRGTLLLDEISEMPLNLQVKLLRVIQEQQFFRVGGTKPISTDVRIIAVTNRNLADLVKERRFREDLYYRLNVVPIEIPPLRERREDIVPLITHFLAKYNKKYNLNVRLSNEIYQYLERHNWPGNVRELQNVIERLVVTCDGNVVSIANLPSNILGQDKENDSPVLVRAVIPMRQAEEMMERALINLALAAGRTTRGAAELLQVAHSTVVRKAARYGLNHGADMHQAGLVINQD